jgi:hypothetical protein
MATEDEYERKFRKKITRRVSVHIRRSNWRRGSTGQTFELRRVKDADVVRESLDKIETLEYAKQK